MKDDQESVRALYQKLLALYPRAFRERLGESMAQTFNDLCHERKQQTAHGWLAFVLGLFVETALGIIREYLLLITQGITMGNFITNPRAAAILSFILALPGAIMYLLLVLAIEPPLGPLQPLLTNPDLDQPNVRGSLIALGMMLLIVVAFIVNLRIIMRAKRTGQSITAYPINLVLAVVTLAFITSIVGSIIVDQYPCWMGVPNCD